jgi:hypothetical protein
VASCRWLVVLLVIGCLLRAGPAQAQPEPIGGGAAIRSAALFLADKGDEYFRAKHYPQALQLLEMAEALHHAPTLLLMIAQCEGHLGRLLDGRSHLQKVIDERLGPYASGPFLRAQAEAHKRLAVLEARIPRVSIRLQGSLEGVEVRIDGAAIPVETLGQELRLDPGTHHVVVLGRHDVQSKTITLDEGARQSIVFDLQRPVAPGAPTAEQSSLLLPVLFLGAGVVGMGAGLVTGVMALNEADQLKSTCTAGNQQCDPDAQSHEDAAKGLATGSTIGFVLGGIGLTVGALLLVTRATEAAPAAETALRLQLGPGSVALQGAF